MREDHSMPPTRESPGMRRVAVMGASGNGKSTLARALAERLDVPYVELDAIHHGPDWEEPELEDFRRRVREATDGEGWVVDGNYEWKLGELVTGRADTIVWLDLPLHVILGRLWSRTYRRWRTHEELWNGNRESLRAAFGGRKSLFVWTVRSHFRHRRQAPQRFAGRPLVRLRSPAEIERFLRG
jgi:energy-coupling factor transporter ATP-binding protein EcfA2